jgi:hypothetical protein
MVVEVEVEEEAVAILEGVVVEEEAVAMWEEDIAEVVVEEIIETIIASQEEETAEGTTNMTGMMVVALDRVMDILPEDLLRCQWRLLLLRPRF